MIDQREIDSKSDELGVPTSDVQRDYVFGWLLAGLYDERNPGRSQLILKGGNAFRKGYFENGRYSNDLDFSTVSSIDPELLHQCITQACHFASERSGVQFFTDRTKIDEVHLARPDRSDDIQMYQARVYFRSFYGEETITLKVKLDVKEFDLILLPIQNRQLIHSYTDREQCRATLRCQKLEELLASKLRAMLQRQHSPDLFDFIYSIFFQKALAVSRLEVVSTFLKKSIYEPSPDIAKTQLLALPFNILRGFWDKYLVCPIQSRISFDQAELNFKTTIDQIFSLIIPSIRRGGTGSSRSRYFQAEDRDIIMEAGRLEQMLRVVYDGVERLVEPYSLTYKRKLDGDAREYFYVWDTSGGRSGAVSIKSFVADKLQRVELTDTKFEPRFPIELAKGSGGYFSASSFSSGPREPRVSDSRSRSKFGLLSPVSRSRARPNPFAISYTVQCPYCGKRFKRDKLDSKLNEHKDKSGNRCPGRIGSFV